MRGDTGVASQHKAYINKIRSKQETNTNEILEIKKNNMAWVPDVMRNQELEKVLGVNTKIEIN